MKYVIAGSSGLIGTSLVAHLRRDGHTVSRLVRRSAGGPDEISWNPSSGELAEDALDGVDGVVNLCGVGIGDKRWSGSYKQLLRDSRIQPTTLLATATADAKTPVLVNASAVGYYGDTGDRIVDENADPGDGFLADLCIDWEAATSVAQDEGVRVVRVRTGLVLSGKGGLLGQLLTLYKLGLGGRLSSGRQYFPWISLEDEVRSIAFALTNSAVSGPMNATGPAPVPNAEFNRTLGRVVHRPAPFVVPAFALRLALGEFADEGVLRGQRAIPTALENAGFAFSHNTIGAALQAALAAPHQ